MRYFYIDTENVQTYSFADNWKLSQDDTVIVFISPNSRNIKFEDLKIFTNTNSNFIYEDVILGEKNAMDFQMVVELTIRAMNDDSSTHYIVSDDCGFKTSVEYLNSKLNKHRVYLIKPNLDSDMWKLIENYDNCGQLHNAIINRYGPDIKKQVYATYRDIFNSIKMYEKNKNDLKMIMLESKDYNCYRNNLRKRFGDKNGNDLYWKTKELYIKVKEEQSKLQNKED